MDNNNSNINDTEAAAKAQKAKDLAAEAAEAAKRAQELAKLAADAQLEAEEAADEGAAPSSDAAGTDEAAKTPGEEPAQTGDNAGEPTADGDSVSADEAALKKPMWKRVLTVIIAAAVMIAAVVIIFKVAKSKSTSGVEVTEYEDTSIASAYQPVYTAAPGSVSKTENVFVNISNTGIPTSTIVSDWIHTDKAAVVYNDISSLSNIKNVKTDTRPLISGTNLVWNMPTTDIYYNGTTTKQLPVTFTIRYYLNGVEMSAQDIAGKEGSVKIEVTMKNNAKTTVTVNNSQKDMYSAFMVMGGIIMPSTDFSNVNIDNGKIVSDGSKNLALMVGFPGFNDSMQLDADDTLKQYKFPETFTITADTKSFATSNIYFAAMPISSLNIDFALPDSLEGVADSFDALKSLMKSVNNIDMSKLMSVMQSDSSTVTDLVSIVNQAVTLYNNNKALIEVLKKYMTEENMTTFKNLLETVQTTMNDQSVTQLLNLLKNLNISKIKSLSESIDAAAPLLSEIESDMNDPEVAQAINNLPETVNQLTQIQEELNAHQSEIDEIMKLLDSDTIDSISSLLSAYSDAMNTNVMTTVQDLMGYSDTLVPLMNKWIEVSKNYKIFTDVADGTSSSVMFIYKTESVEPAETSTSK